MRIPISPVTVDGIECIEAEVSVAVSSSVAIRVVPVDAAGTEYPDAFLGVVGDTSQSDVAAFLSQVSEATQQLLEARGI